MDASEGVLGLDATIGGYAHEGGRAVVLCVNKWDIAKEKNKAGFVQSVRRELKFLEYAPVTFVSAIEGAGISQLFGLVRRGYRAACNRVGTGELNRFLEAVELEKDLKVKYITQASVRPPTFVVFTEGSRPLHFSTERYLANQLRKRFEFPGTPIVIKSKSRPAQKSRRRRHT